MVDAWRGNISGCDRNAKNVVEKSEQIQTRYAKISDAPNIVTTDLLSHMDRLLDFLEAMQ